MSNPTLTKINIVLEIDCKKKHALSLTNSYILPILGLDSIHIKKWCHYAEPEYKYQKYILRNY